MGEILPSVPARTTHVALGWMGKGSEHIRSGRVVYSAAFDEVKKT